MLLYAKKMKCHAKKHKKCIQSTSKFCEIISRLLLTKARSQNILFSVSKTEYVLQSELLIELEAQIL